jgi:hypothetical protein
MQSEEKIVNEMVDTAKKFLDAIDGIEIIDVEREVKVGHFNLIIDVQMRIRLNGNDSILNFEFLPEGSPKMVKNALLKLNVYKTFFKNSYSIVMGHYLSREALDILEKNDIGGLDLSGNSFFKTNGIYFFKTGFKNKFPVKRKPRRKFSKKEARIPHILLLTPEEDWTATKLARAARVSYSLCRNALIKLKNRDIIDKKSKDIQIINIYDLANLCLINYSGFDFIVPMYSKENKTTILRNITKYFKEKKTNYAFTGTAAASLLSKDVNAGNIDFYIEATKEINFFEELGFSYDPEKTSNLINIILPEDPIVFCCKRTIDDIMIVSDVQLYIDLMQQGIPESRDLAMKILKKRILKKQYDK